MNDLQLSKVRFIVDDENGDILLRDNDIMIVARIEQREVRELIDWLRKSQQTEEKGGKLTIRFEFDTSVQTRWDNMEIRRITQSLDMAQALWEIQNNLIREVEREIERKYKDPDDCTYSNALSIVGNRIAEIIDDNGLSLDHLIE